jgi:YD repeat-containing protein
LVTFLKGDSGEYKASASKDRLIRTGTGFLYFDSSELAIEEYDLGGVLRRITFHHGIALNFEYSNGTLVKVSDTYGRSVEFEYQPLQFLDYKPVITKFIDPNGFTVGASYRGGSLSGLTWQDNQAPVFHYEHPTHLWALTGIVDERGKQKARFGWDSYGHAISTIRGWDSTGYSVTYEQLPYVRVEEDSFDVENWIAYRTRRWQFPVNPIVTTPSGGSSALGVADVAGNPGKVSESQPAGSGCAASSRTQSFDANGNLQHQDDFNGNRTCYRNDATRNLETARVEGLNGGANGTACSSVMSDGAALPTGSRKTTTQWHPDWPLRAKEAKPGLITHWVYHGRPDPTAGNAIANCAPADALLPDGKPTVVLCKEVQQPTTDPSGALGFDAVRDGAIAVVKRSWTYNRTGQVLTETDPKGGVTTYEYYTDTEFTALEGHTVGDLKKVTNAAQHVTQFNSYDKAGRLIQSTDSNQVVTRNSYSKRGLLLSTDVGGHTTTYSYDPVGNLIEIKQPDGVSVVGYEYDDAQRLKAITGRAGHRVDFTLDAFGNRTAEKVGAGGPDNVRSSVTRSVDALGRIQQINGRE